MGTAQEAVENPALLLVSVGELPFPHQPGTDNDAFPCSRSVAANRLVSMASQILDPV